MTVLKHIRVHIFQKAVRRYGVNGLVENKTDNFAKAILNLPKVVP